MPGRIQTAKFTDVKCPTCGAQPVGNQENWREARKCKCLARKALARKVTGILVEHFNVVEEACTGEAHSNPHIDHCMVCLPRWGVVEKLVPKHLEEVIDHRHDAGLIAENKRTGAVVYLAKAQGIDVDGDKYAVVCRHNNICGSRSERDARVLAASCEFCEDCRNLYGEEEKPEPAFPNISRMRNLGNIPVGSEAHPPVATHARKVNDGKEAAAVVRSFGLEPGKRLESHEDSITILVIDATGWGRSRYLGTLILVDDHAEEVISTFHIKS